MAIKSIGINILVLIISVMNLWIKYGPLAYTWNTRIFGNGVKGLKNLFFGLFSYLFFAIGIRMIPLIYFYINHTIKLSQLTYLILLYIILFLIFSIFYEIGYLHNDFVAKKEINPTIHIHGKVDKKFYIIQIILRFVFGFLGFFLLYYFNPEILKPFIVLIVVTLAIFLLHNFIRNYFYNFMTLLGLRFMKFSLIFIVLYSALGTFDSVYYFYMGLLFFMFQCYTLIMLYNERMGGINKINVGLGKYFYLFLSNIIFYFLSKDFLFIYYAVLYLFIFIIFTPKEYFRLKNNR